MKRRAFLGMVGIAGLGAALRVRGAVGGAVSAHIISAFVAYEGNTPLTLGESAVYLGLTDTSGEAAKSGCLLTFQQPAADAQRYRVFAMLRAGDRIDPLHHRVCGVYGRRRPDGSVTALVVVEII